MKFTTEQFADRAFRQRLHPRVTAYFCCLSVGRRLGYYRPDSGQSFWVASLRVRGDFYRRQRLGRADDAQSADGSNVLDFEQAVSRAKDWFALPEFFHEATDTKPVGECCELNVCPVGDVYTVYHAIRDFLAWKRSFGTKGSFVACVAMANRYALPLIGTRGSMNSRLTTCAAF